MNNRSIANLNVDYLRNGIYENKLRDVNQSITPTNVFKFNKIFTISNAINEIQKSDNYKVAIDYTKVAKSKENVDQS